jgi:hypothetical protein
MGWPDELPGKRGSKVDRIRWPAGHLAEKWLRDWRFNLAINMAT